MLCQLIALGYLRIEGEYNMLEPTQSATLIAEGIFKLRAVSILIAAPSHVMIA